MRNLIPRLDEALYANIIPFWYPRCLDHRHGGYTVDFTSPGQPTSGRKRLVTQARMLWLFARLAEDGRCNRADMLGAADLGYRFLHERMRDPRHGGFYWEVDDTGERVTDGEKQVYGQAFALYALSQFALASGRADVLDDAAKLADLLETSAHDAAHAGYLESFSEDWTPTSAQHKRMNTHLHMLEAMVVYYRASERPDVRERILELITVLTTAIVRKNPVACTDEHERDWRPRRDARVSYGHDLENIWLVVDACEAVGVSHSPFHELFRELCTYALRYGFDRRRGGFYMEGPLGRPASRRDKVWWVQAEALVALLYVWRMTGDTTFLRAFEQTWQHLDTRQIDWLHGEWHAIVAPDGSVRGSKADHWKEGYHTGRSMLECLSVLRNMPAHRPST